MNDLNHETLFKTPGEGHPFISWRHKKKLDIDFILLLTLFSTHTHAHTQNFLSPHEKIQTKEGDRNFMVTDEIKKNKNI